VQEPLASEKTPRLQVYVAVPGLPFVDVTTVDEPEFTPAAVPEHVYPEALHVSACAGQFVREQVPPVCVNVPAVQLYVAVPALPFVDVTVAVEPESVAAAFPEHVFPEALQVLACAGQLGSVHVPPVCVNVPALQLYVAVPLLPFVDVTDVDEPEAVAAAFPEHVAPDTVQLLVCAGHPGSVHVPLVYVYAPPEHKNVPVPALPFVDVTVVDAPAIAVPALPEHVFPDAIQVSG
jgi:hypothetical protein